jgi:hypothetical protein
MRKPDGNKGLYGRVFHMRRNHVSGIFAVLAVAVLLASAVFSLSGCGNDEDVSDKLDSRLNRLVDAEKRGEAELYARQHGIDLVDGSVRVEIKCEAGQLEAAVKAAANFGTVEIVAEKVGWVQALIPITSLTALTKEESIHFIRVPMKAVPLGD